MPNLADYLSGLGSDFYRGLQVLGSGAQNLPENFARGMQAPPEIFTLQNLNEAAGRTIADTLGTLGETADIGKQAIRASVGLDPNRPMREDLMDQGMPLDFAGKIGGFTDVFADPLLLTGSRLPRSSVPIAAERPAIPGVTWRPPPPPSTLGQQVKAQIGEFLGSEGPGRAPTTSEELLRNTGGISARPTGYETFGRITPAEEQALLKKSESMLRDNALRGTETQAFTIGGPRGPLIYDAGLSRVALPHELEHAKTLEALRSNVPAESMPSALDRLTVRAGSSPISQARGASELFKEIGGHQAEGVGKGWKYLLSPEQARTYASQYAAHDPTGTAQALHNLASGPLRPYLEPVSRIPNAMWQALKYGGAGAGMYATMPGEE